MTNKVFLMVGALLSLTSCNLYGGIDKPSGDNQILMAARACLDHGDYVCAQQNYQALSNNENDVKVSELALTALAQNGLFSMSDLLLALGSDRGSAKSLTAMSGLIAGRGKTDGTSRANIQSVFVSLTTIQDAKLKAFMQFLTATALVNQILAGAITSNNALAITDLVTGACAGICATDATCAKPAADLLLDTDVSGEPSSNWPSAMRWSTSPIVETRPRWASMSRP